jgi:hypothetical protein
MEGADEQVIGVVRNSAKRGVTETSVGRTSRALVAGVATSVENGTMTLVFCEVGPRFRRC